MNDKSPIFAKPKLGMLAPHGPAAVAAFAAIDGIVTLKISGGKRNQRRRALYWLTNAIVCQVLNDLHDLSLTEDELHDITRDKLGMFDEVVLPSGQVFKRYLSTSDRKMAEPDRAAFTDKAFSLWSNWTGVPVETLLAEAEAA